MVVLRLGSNMGKSSGKKSNGREKTWPCQGRVRAAKEASKKKQGDDLGFPGAKPTSPIHYAGYTIYVCPQSSNFRVKKDGEKKDKAFSWKSCEATKTWDRVVDFLTA